MIRAAILVGAVAAGILVAPVTASSQVPTQCIVVGPGRGLGTADLVAIQSALITVLAQDPGIVPVTSPASCPSGNRLDWAVVRSGGAAVLEASLSNIPGATARVSMSVPAVLGPSDHLRIAYAIAVARRSLGH